MASRKGPKNRTPNRTGTRKPPALSPERPTGDISDLPEAGLLDGVDEALKNPDPLALLSLVSGLLAIIDPRQKHPMSPKGDPELPSLIELCDSFMDIGFRQTDAVLLVIAAMSGDEVLAKRVRKSVAGRRHPLPGWLLRLDQVAVLGTVEMLHVLRDGDNVALGVRLPGGRDCSALVYIDHNMGTVVKDAFILEAPLAEVTAKWTEFAPDDDTTVTDLSPADARARVSEAIDKGAITFPPFESDSWPMCRPLIEWIVSMMPEGGTGYVRPEWSEAQLAKLTGAFFASEFGRALDDEDHRDLLRSILWFGTDYGPGDPMRWSPVSAEILLDDWIPRKIMAPADFLAKAPELLRGFVRYCHAERNIPATLTTDTLAAVDAWEPGYQEAIRKPRQHGSMALLEQAGLFDAEGGVDPDELNEYIEKQAFLGGGMDDDDLPAFMLKILAREVGGTDALDGLDTEPLPDEPLDLSDVPDDIRSRVAGVSHLADGCADALFDVEFRTAARRLLARIAAADPRIFRRKGSDARTAATVCWIIGQANRSFHYVYVRDLMAHFDLTGSVSQKAEVLLRALGIGWDYQLYLGDPSLLVSRHRADIAQARVEFADELD